jgi:glyoxylase-like metal-dependent hydrolase (beta-lactamase superfamily II)
MKKVAVFGNAGGGKSTLASRLADLTRLPLHTVDMIKFKAGGEAFEQVRALGFAPNDVRHVLLTHLDRDHAGGLSDFVAEPPLAAAGVLANGGWLGASLGPCRLVTFRFF